MNNYHAVGVRDASWEPRRWISAEMNDRKAKEGGGECVGQKVSAARRPFISPAPLPPPRPACPLRPRPFCLAPARVWRTQTKERRLSRRESKGLRSPGEAAGSAGCWGRGEAHCGARARSRSNASPRHRLPSAFLPPSSATFCCVFGAQLMFPGAAFPSRRSGRCPIIPFPVFEQVFTGPFCGLGHISAVCGLGKLRSPAAPEGSAAW